MRFITPFLLLFLCLSSLSQQEVSYYNYTTENGLSSNTVFSISQDSRGYLYIGNNQGIDKFNGRVFRPCYCENESKALGNITPLNAYTQICRNFHGDSYLLKKDTLTLFETGIHEVWGFPSYIKHNNQVFTYRNNHFSEIDINGVTKTIDLPFLTENGKIWSVAFEDDIGYFSINDSIAKLLIAYDFKKKKTISKRLFSSNSDIKLYPFEKCVLWMNHVTGDVGDVRQNFRTRQNIYEAIDEENLKLTSLTILPDGRFVISSFNGIYLFDQNWNFRANYLNAIQCTELLIDKDNTLWVGSLQNGLFHIPSLDVITVQADLLPGKNTRFSKVYAIEDRILAGTFDGRVIEFNQKGQVLRFFDLGVNAEIQSFGYHNNNILVYCSGLYPIDDVTGKINARIEVTATKAITSYEDSLLLFTSKGLGVYTNQQVSMFIDTLWLKNGYKLSNAELLLESSKDIFIFNPVKNENRIIDSGGSDLCIYNNSYYYRKGNTIYILNRNLEAEILLTFDTTIERLFATKDGLFILTKTDKIKHIFPGEIWELNKPPALKLNNTRRIIALKEQYVIANSNAIFYLPKNHAYTISKPTLNLITTTGDFTATKNTIELPYNNNKLSLVFDLLPNLFNQGKGEVRYRIPEFDSTWSLTIMEDHYTIDLLRIPSGNYNLEVVGVDQSGQLSNQLNFLIIVATPFYLKWWFILLLGLTIVLIGILSWRWRASLLRQRNKRELEKQRLKLQALNAELVAIRSQMNPHFIFNSLSSIQTKILNEDRVAAYENLSTFAILLRQALQFTSKEFISLEDEMSFIRNYIALELMRTENAFSYTENIQKNIVLRKERIPSLILQPIVENAIRHGLMHLAGNKQLAIEIIKNDSLVIKITDNGIGRKASEKINARHNPTHQSFATKATQDRIDVLSATNKMQIKTQIVDREQGTEVIIELISP